MVQIPGQMKMLKSFFATRFRDRIFLFASILILFLWLVACAISREPGQHAVLQFFAIAVFMLLITIGVLLVYARTKRKLPFTAILLTAIALRLCSLAGEPLFEDDYYRYMWDGYQMATTGDPYTLAPSHFFDKDIPEPFEPILSLINYPDIATVYGPFSQWVFALAYHIDAAAVWPLQLVAGVADILVLCALYLLGAGNAMLLYAWSPLLLKEFSLTAHPDIYGIAGMVLAILALKRQRMLLSGVLLALGFSAKVFAILALPFLLTATTSLRDSLKILVGFAGTLLAVTAWYGDPIIWVPDGLQAMAQSWLFNAPLYLLLLPYTPVQTIKAALLALFCLYALLVLIRRTRLWLGKHTPLPSHQPWPASKAGFRGDWLYFLFLLSLPVANPWYLTWVLPFAVLYRSAWAWIASVAMLLSYYYGVYIGIPGTGYQQLPVAVIFIEYSLIVLGGSAAYFWMRRDRTLPYSSST